MSDLIPWLNDGFLGAIEGAVSAYLGRAWRVEGASDLSDLACHPVAILTEGTFGVFAKLGTRAGCGAAL